MASIFISYASEDLAIARQLYFALVNLDHNVFFDKENLRSGDEYNFKIIDGIRESDIAILLLSPEFFSENAYCKTELKIMQTNWPIPKGKVFPFITREVSFDILPDYIKSVTISEIHGNLVAEIVLTIQNFLLGFDSSESMSMKIRNIELERQLQSLDLEWSQNKRSYLIKIQNEEFKPTRELAIGALIFYLVLGFLGYLIVRGSEYVPAPIILCLILGVISFLYINWKAGELKSAEKRIHKERTSIINEMSQDNNLQ